MALWLNPFRGLSVRTVIGLALAIPSPLMRVRHPNGPTELPLAYFTVQRALTWPANEVCFKKLSANQGVRI